MRPAPSSTRRCFTIACRVTRAPPASAVAESAPVVPSLRTRERRVPSPRAKKTSALACSRAFDILLQVFCLRRPATLVHAEGALAPMSRHPVEARLDDRELGAFRDRFQAELDER